MQLYTVVDDNPVWLLGYKDALETVERLHVSRKDVRRYGTLGRVPARKPADDAERPDLEFYAWSRARFYSHTAFSRFFERHGDVECVMHGEFLHVLNHRDPQARRPLRALFVREGGVVEIKGFQSGHLDYAAVLHIRKWVLVLPLLLAALLLCLSLSLCSPSGSGSPSFLDEQTPISGSASKPILTTSYASYSATPDTVWRAGETRQDMTLLLPDTCTVKGETGGNPVMSSPSIAVDLNADGEFSDSEIVYNAPDETGYGRFLRPGSKVEHIDLAEPLAAGEYSARTIWHSVLSEDGKTPAGVAIFDWRLTVE